MNRIISIVCLLFGIFAFVACTGTPIDGGDTSEIVVSPEQQEYLSQSVDALATEGQSVTFTTEGAWTSVINTTRADEEWVSITPDHGDAAGTYTITITLTPNETSEERYAEIVIRCGEHTIKITITQGAATDTPSGGNDDDSEVQQKYVSTIDYRYTDTVDEYESAHYILTYKYDEKNRVVRVEEICDAQESYESYEIWHTFDYSIVDNIDITSSFKSGGDDSTKDETYEVTLEGGRATQALLKGEYEMWDTYKYSFGYDDAGYLVRMVQHCEEYGEEGSNITYENGLLTGVIWDEYGEEDDDSMVYDIETFYPHRYPNDKTNVDFNMFLFNGGPQLEGDIVSLLVSLRKCGKFGDACVEIGGGGDEYDFMMSGDFVSDPNYREHFSVSRTKPSSDLYPAIYEFDGDGCPTKISYDVVYEEYLCEYDLVATSEMIKTPEGDMYATTIENYTATKTGEILCPAVYTITYKE